MTNFSTRSKSAAALFLSALFCVASLQAAEPLDSTGAADGLSDISEDSAPAAGTEGAAIIKRLNAFMTDLSSFSADFTQALYDESGELLQQSSGNLQIKRPGKFFWSYEEPDRQDIVTNGEQLWLYDHELEQVTVSPVDERISGTPLALLTGGTALGDQFSIEPLGPADGIDWLQLIPEDAGSDFEMVFIGLDSVGVVAMELQDSFGQATQIQFSNVQTNLALDNSLFDFSAPAGVDVIGEAVQ